MYTPEIEIDRVCLPYFKEIHVVWTIPSSKIPKL